MKAAPFAFRSASTLDEAVEALAALGAAAKVVAGSQSLGPMLNLRLARPTHLVDLGRLADLRGAVEDVAHVRYGAAVTHAEIEDGEVPDATPGWLRAAAGNIAHRAVRNRGTLGGSLAHADPAADWLIVMTGLGASVGVAGPAGSRTVPVDRLARGPFATCLEPGEIIFSVTVPRPGPCARWGYWKFTRQAGEFARASAVVLDDPARGTHRVALGALDGPPLLLDDPAAIVSGTIPPAAAVARALPRRTAATNAAHVTALTRALALAGAEMPAGAAP